MGFPSNYGTIVRSFCAILVLSGCATAVGSSPDSNRRNDRNLLTQDDFEEMRALNAYEAIRRLRPTWLQSRGPGVLTGADRESLRVYVDRTLFGNADALARLMVRDLKEIRYLDSRQATLRFGTDHTLGAIVITTGGG